MHYEVSITEQAERDLQDIFDYIALELLSPDHAAGQLDRLEAAIENLEFFPERHRKFEFEPWRSRNLRVLPVDHYVVFYIPDHNELTVTVIRVIYGGRDINTQLERYTNYKT
ncbi:MAG: type II toxin-antitoxin system RelE/ParE family toxin [Lachnospiraceae bacterium]|nr:type II toxin-antitoxin system RelE/ParE family toxin [Lachnospiraceae bacterium]